MSRNSDELSAPKGRILVIRAAIFVVLLLTLAACGGGPAARPAASVRVAPELALTLPQPGDLGRNVEASQLLTARYGDQAYVFEGRLSATSDRFLMVGLDPMGRELLRINWTRTGVEYSAAPWLPADLRVENILADIVLLYWPEETVRRILVPAGGTLVSTFHRRQVLIGDKEVMQADFQPVGGENPWSGRVHYRNLAWGYELDIQSSEMSP
jgi:hypothetical protein